MRSIPLARIDIFYVSAFVTSTSVDKSYAQTALGRPRQRVPNGHIDWRVKGAELAVKATASGRPECNRMHRLQRRSVVANSHRSADRSEHGTRART